MTPNQSKTWVGRFIDHYEVLSLIGAGGMGVVYRARDTRLSRYVALKVLPEEFSGNREHIIRSEREARLLASLNHPNIAAIYDMKDLEGDRCLVLEYVEGETLAERLRSGRFPLAEALEIARQIGQALNAAHGAGIIHRDIKPANIKVTPEGRVKVLDFGLAKSLTAEQLGIISSDAPTLVTQTLAPVILGTPGYMSPEQLRGGTIDKRTDVWAFGCVLYELLTGRQTFPGNNLPEIIASVLKSDPDWSALPQETPPHVRQLVTRCLEKDPAQRLQNVTDVRPEMQAESRQATRSLAVLPFVNAAANPEMDYLSDGLTESIILSLSKLSELQVMSRTAVFRYKGRSEEAQSVGKELGVQAVLTGRVLQRGEALLITTELVDVENGWQLWGDQYRRRSADIFEVEEEIAREISEKLRLTLTPEKKHLRTKRYTENVAAYHLYLRGRFHWGKRTAEGLHRGIEYFRQAIENDPTYALAYAGLAEGYVPLGVYCHVAPKDAFPKAKAAAQKALEIDPELSEAKAVLSAVRAFFEWDLSGGEKEARAAIELDPNYPRARQTLSECLVTRGAFSEAVLEIKRALDLDPLSLHMNAAVTMILYLARLLDEAIDHGRRTLEIDTNFFPSYWYLGLAYVAKGQYAEAVDSLRQATVLSSNSTLMLANLGRAFGFWGKEKEARNVLRELDEVRSHKYISQVSLAGIYTALGETDRAFTCLERAYEDRCYWLMRSVANDPLFDRLRGIPQFENLAQRLGLSPTADIR
jgi:eukaryotic-like serine/threonine-protein kinase